MAKIPKQSVLDDIELQLTQGAPDQALEVEQLQVAFWINQELNTLISQECNSALKQGKQINPIYLVRETCKQLTEEVTPCVSDDDGNLQRFYFSLTGSVVDLDNDNGIVQV